MSSPVRRRFNVAVYIIVSLLFVAHRNAPVAFAQQPPIDLGTLGGPETQATALNASGHVAGASDTATGARHAFFWSPSGGMIDLGTLGGTTSTATAMNDHDQVVGQSALAGDTTRHAFSWTPGGGMIDLGTLGGSHSAALDVNVNGHVVGHSTTAAGVSHVFLWTPETGMIDLALLGGLGPTTFSQATAISDAGEVIGFQGNQAPVAFSWTSTAGMLGLGTLGGLSSVPLAVNLNGQVVGSSSIGPLGTHAFSWTATGGMFDLGTLGGTFSEARAVNAAGHIAGSSTLLGNDVMNPFVWTPVTGMVDLGNFGGTHSLASDLNANGQVVGQSSLGIFPGQARGFSWTPTGGLIALGTLGGDYSGASRVNDAGIILGHSLTPTNLRRAVLWVPANRPPAIVALTATPSILWPPNHVLVPVTLTVSASDGSAVAPSCRISAINLNQPNRTPGRAPWVITGPLTVDLLATRDGRGDREYTLTVTCTNTSQLSDTREVVVRVPHDSRAR